MTRLPVIVGFGGVNPAGRVSFHHAYKRLVFDALAESDLENTYASLASLMNLTDSGSDPATRSWINDHTLIRRIEHFDPDAVPWQRRVKLKPSQGDQSFVIDARQFPAAPPDNWQWQQRDNGDFDVTVKGDLDVLLPDIKPSKVSCAGQLPTGFKPETLYQSRNHPRGLQLAIFGASDAIRSLGMDWAECYGTVGQQRQRRSAAGSLAR